MRRWVALVVVAALTLGLAAHGLAAHMDARMTAAAAVGDMSSSDGCKACAGNDTVSTTACFAFCSNAVVAVLPEPVTLGLAIVETTIALPVQSVIGRIKPPDLHPPKTVALS